MTLEKMKSMSAFICWKRLPDKSGRMTKVPFGANDGGQVGTTQEHRSRWGTYTQADANYKFNKRGFDGIGIVFTKVTDSLSICGIDIDGSAEDDDEVKAIIAMFPNAYIERSPSGNGIHIILLVDVSRIPQKEKNGRPALDPKYYSKNPNNGVETYIATLTNRYFTVTEDTIQDGKDIDQTDEFLRFLDLYMVRGTKKSENKTQKSNKQNNIDISDDELLQKARSASNGAKFSALFDRGDIGRYKSPSNADQALCNLLAFWTRCDAARMERLFTLSALGGRGKWQERDDYRQMTIERAIADCAAVYEPNNQEGEEFGKGGKPTFSEAVLTEYLANKGISLRYNVINKTVEIKGVCGNYNPETLQNDLPIILYDALKTMVKKCDKTAVQDLLGVIAGKNRYNPVTEMLDGGKWDGRDRIEEFYGILGVANADTLSRTLVYKWLWQGLSMARNELENAYGADGVLVFQGKQGLGKTSVARKLAVKPELCKLGQHLDSRDKDTYRRAVSAWIVEFGEIETTFRSDLERLKAFITCERDEYRLPYGRADQTLVRRTVIIGTCNSDRFLIDPTGSRRFWTVPVHNIDLDRLAQFDALQLWLQVDHETRHNPQGFRLTKEEQAQLAERNGEHEKLLPAQAEVMDILTKTNTVYRDATVTEFKEAHTGLRGYSVDQISKALNRLGIEQRNVNVTVDGKRTKARVRTLPMWKPNYWQ